MDDKHLVHSDSSSSVDAIVASQSAIRPTPSLIHGGVVHHVASTGYPACVKKDRHGFVYVDQTEMPPRYSSHGFPVAPVLSSQYTAERKREMYDAVKMFPRIFPDLINPPMLLLALTAYHPLNPDETRGGATWASPVSSSKVAKAYRDIIQDLAFRIARSSGDDAENKFAMFLNRIKEREDDGANNIKKYINEAVMGMYSQYGHVFDTIKEMETSDLTHNNAVGVLLDPIFTKMRELHQWCIQEEIQMLQCTVAEMLNASLDNLTFGHNKVSFCSLESTDNSGQDHFLSTYFKPVVNDLVDDSAVVTAMVDHYKV